jgi:ribosomal protein S18 acetylase RimI-like enzyme
MTSGTRPATLADAAAIGALQLRAWRWNYQDIVDPQELAEWDEESRGAHWVPILESGDTATLVADVAGAVRGFASIGRSREPDAAPGEGEIWALYVDPPAQGAGVGIVLLEAAEEGLRGAGYRSAALRTLSENGLARGFYERHGWAYVEGRDEPHPWGTHVLYRRAL